MDELKTLENIAQIFVELKQPSKALEYYQQALAISKRLDYQNNEEKILEAINRINRGLST